MEEIVTTANISEKVFELSERFNHYIFENPAILDHIPDKAMLVFLDADDPTFNEANLALVDTLPWPSGSQRVYVKMHKRVRLVEQVLWEAEIVPRSSNGDTVMAG